MKTARDNIFARLKGVLDQRHNPTVRTSGADQRMKGHARGLIPLRGQADDKAVSVLFENEARTANAEVVRVSSMADIVSAALAIAMKAGAKTLKVAPHPALMALDWPGDSVTFGIGAGDDMAGLSMAYAGIAETGTLVMRSGDDTPTSLNFLPDVHIVALRNDAIKACYEDVWDLLRADGASRKATMPRTVNWITGPSRTADIEQTILLGAHGPRKLIILIVDEDA